MERHYFVAKLIDDDGTEHIKLWNGVYHVNCFQTNRIINYNKKSYVFEYGSVNTIGVFHYANYREHPVKYYG